MNVCGIDLKGNEVIIVSLSGNKKNCHQLEPGTKKFKLIDSKSQSAVQDLYDSLRDYATRNHIEEIAIKERATKGRFAGGPTSFKMEGLIQLFDIKVAILHGRTLEAKIKGWNLDLSDLNQYQCDAYKLAFACLSEET